MPLPPSIAGGHAWLDALGRRLAATFFRQPAAVYWVSADLATLMRSAGVRHTEAEAFADALLDTLRRAAGPQTTLLVSAFNFDLPGTKVFDVVTGAVDTGAFGTLLLRRHADHRTPQPFYSFLAFGPKQADLLDKPFPNNTGADSILGWLVEQRAELVTIGHHYVKSLSSVHHAEDEVAVPYRYRKAFSGEVVRPHERLAVTVTFFVRELGVCDHSSLTLAGDRLFRRLGMVHTLPLGTRRHAMLAHMVNLADAHRQMVDSLRRGGPDVAVDYLGPQRQDSGVITPKIANRLYLDELAVLRTEAPDDCWEEA